MRKTKIKRKSFPGEEWASQRCLSFSLYKSIQLRDNIQFEYCRAPDRKLLIKPKAQRRWKFELSLSPLPPFPLRLHTHALALGPKLRPKTTLLDFFISFALRKNSSKKLFISFPPLPPPPPLSLLLSLEPFEISSFTWFNLSVSRGDRLRRKKLKIKKVFISFS